MAISKIILNGVTQMDVTGKTVTAGSMLNGVTALKNDGTDVTGNIENMTLPSASSSTSSGTAKATITPGSSAQYLNIPTGYNSAAAYYTIAAASGGASNIVTGTFTGTTTGAPIDISLNYSGNGYPIAVLIFPKDGAEAGTFASTIKRYAIQTSAVVKVDASTTPAYENGTNDKATVLTRYKNSTSSATTYTQSANSAAATFSDENAGGSTIAQTVKIRSATKLSVMIAANNYGFLTNIEYRYIVIYSS